MTASLPRPSLLVLPALLAALVYVLFAPPAAHARSSDDCARRRGTIAVAPLGRVWHRGATLYACTSVYDIRPRAVRIGRWSRATRVAFDGVSVAWTDRRTIAGARADRVWVADLQDRRRWLPGVRALPAAGATPAAEDRVRWLSVYDAGVAWITVTGDLVLGLHDPGDAPKPVGPLPGALQPSGRLLRVGRWSTPSPAQLAASAQFTETALDGDECGGIGDYRLTIAPGAPDARAGVVWSGYWSRPNCG